MKENESTLYIEHPDGTKEEVWRGVTSVAKMNKEIDEFIRSDAYKALKAHIRNSK